MSVCGIVYNCFYFQNCGLLTPPHTCYGQVVCILYTYPPLGHTHVLYTYTQRYTQRLVYRKILPNFGKYFFI